MIGQRIGLPYLVPLALERLRQQPFNEPAGLEQRLFLNGIRGEHMPHG